MAHLASGVAKEVPEVRPPAPAICQKKYMGYFNGTQILIAINRAA
jgi:hypothetical protein